MVRMSIILVPAVTLFASAGALAYGPAPTPAGRGSVRAMRPAALASIVEANSLPERDVDLPAESDDQAGRGETDPANRRPRTIAVVIMAIISLLAVGIIWRMVRTVFQGRNEAGRAEDDPQP